MEEERKESERFFHEGSKDKKNQSFSRTVPTERNVFKL